MENKFLGKKKRRSFASNSLSKKDTNLSVFLLTKLIQSAPHYLSGSELANLLNMSRVGIWSRINKLRKNGIQVDATQNLGYRFAGEPNFVEENMINAWLEYYNAPACNVYVRDEVPSTNSEVEKILPDLNSKKPLIFIANHQTNGKGRFKNQWESPKGGNLYMSIGFKPDVDVLKLRYFTLLQGIEITRLLQRELNREEIKVKWPNDIFMNGKKIGGMLTEASVDCETINSLIFGFGLNLNKTPKNTTSHFKISSVKEELNSTILVNEITAKIIKLSIATYKKCMSNKSDKVLLSEWGKYDFLHKKSVSLLVGKKKVHGVAYGIDESGGLKLKLRNGRFKVFHAGEVSVKK